ncbi:hypothetical protein OEA23_09740 [Paenibacillus polysaccharolyticus]
MQMVGFEGMETGLVAAQGLMNVVVGLVQNQKSQDARIALLEERLAALVLQRYEVQSPNLRGVDSGTCAASVIDSMKSYALKIGADYSNPHHRASICVSIYRDFHQHTGVLMDRRSVFPGERLVDGYVRIGQGPALKKFIDEYTGVVNVGTPRKSRKKPKTRQRRRAKVDSK